MAAAKQSCPLAAVTRNLSHTVTLNPDLQMADEYALGVRPSLEDAIEAVIRILGMQPCEGSDAVPPNARCGSQPGFRDTTQCADRHRQQLRVVRYGAWYCWGT